MPEIIVAERYRIITQIGQGGMGTVYQAHDIDLGRDVALKLLPPHLSHNAQFVQRFQREATTLVRLEHAHIVPTYDMGEHDGSPFLVMRLLRGGSLQEQMQQQALAQTDLWRILSEVASGLDAAHAQNVIHRDIKPTNILFDEQNTAFISDFGIAKIVDATTDLTNTGVLGSPAYMSPEQFTGKGIDGRSDQYSLAVLVFEALTGQLPFDGNTVQMMYHHLHENPPSVRHINQSLSPRLDPVLHKAMAKKPADRFETVTTFISTLVATAVTEPESPLLPLKPDHSSRTPQKTTTSRWQQVEVAYNQGLQALAREQWQYAAEAFERVLVLEPNHPKAHQRLQEAQRHRREDQTSASSRPALKRQNQPHRQRVIVPGAGGRINNKNPNRKKIIGVLFFLFILMAVGGIIASRSSSAAQANAASLSIETAVPPTPDVIGTKNAATPPFTISSGASSETSGIKEIPWSVGEVLTIESGEAMKRLQLPDGAQAVLEKGTKIILDDGVDGIVIRLEEGRILLTSAVQPITVVNLFGDRAALSAEGLMGVSSQEPLNLFRVDCFRGECTLYGGLSGEQIVDSGTASWVGSNGRPTALSEAAYSEFVLLALEDLPTPRPTEQVDILPTPTRTPLPNKTAVPAPTTAPISTETATPAVVDTDGDGIPDIDDLCKEYSGPRETQGCPPPSES